MEPMIDVVNRKDEVIGQIPESQVHKNVEVITRAVTVLVYNSKGEILLQKRSKKMWRFPLHWTASASGSINQGEEPITAAIRELKEETGVEVKKEDMTFMFKKYTEDDIKHIIYVYKAVINKVKDVSNPEVDSVQYFSIKKIRDMIKNKEKISPFFLGVFNTIYDFHDN
jgi:isopentenyl-diphosphate delta-isomerase type 1